VETRFFSEHLIMQLVCFTEEPSAKTMLEIILPKLIPSIETTVINFEGKQDLEKNIENKLRLWQTPDTVFLVTRDQDSGDCQVIKERLLQKVINSGKENVSLIRIACHELESFYLGDLLAVERGMNIANLSKKQKKKKFRTPDTIVGAKEELQKIAKTYQSVSGSRNISKYLKLDGNNKSTSFNFLISGIKKLCSV
jgi:hypothetical protein